MLTIVFYVHSFILFLYKLGNLFVEQCVLDNINAVKITLNHKLYHR